MYVCAPYAYLVLGEVGRGRRIPWNYNWLVLGIKLTSSTRTASEPGVEVYAFKSNIREELHESEANLSEYRYPGHQGFPASQRTSPGFFRVTAHFSMKSKAHSTYFVGWLKNIGFKVFTPAHE